MNLADHLTTSHKDENAGAKAEQKAGLLLSMSDHASDAMSLKSGGGCFKTFTFDDDCSFWDGSQAGKATFGNNACTATSSGFKDPYRRPTVDKEDSDMISKMKKEEDPLRLSLSVLDQDFSNVGHSLGLDGSNNKRQSAAAAEGTAARMHESLPSKLDSSSSSLMGPMLPKGKLAPCSYDTDLMSPLINKKTEKEGGAEEPTASTADEEAAGTEEKTAKPPTSRPTKPRSGGGGERGGGGGGGTGGKSRKPRRDRTDGEKKRTSKSPKRNINSSGNNQHNVRRKGSNDAKKAVEMLATDFKGAMKALAHNQQQQKRKDGDTDPTGYNRSMTADSAAAGTAQGEEFTKVRRSNTDTQIPQKDKTSRRKQQQQQDLLSESAQHGGGPSSCGPGLGRSLTTGPTKNRLSRSITDGTKNGGIDRAGLLDDFALEPTPTFKSVPKATLKRSNTDTKIDHQQSKSRNSNSSSGMNSSNRANATFQPPKPAGLNRSMTETVKPASLSRSMTEASGNGKQSRRTGQYGPKVLSTGSNHNTTSAATSRLAGGNNKKPSSSSNNNNNSDGSFNAAATLHTSNTKKTMIDISSNSNRGRIEKSMDNSNSKLLSASVGDHHGRGRGRRSDNNALSSSTTTTVTSNCTRRLSPHRSSAGMNASAPSQHPRTPRGRSAPRHRRTRSLETATKNRTGKDVMEERRLARQERQAARRKQEEEEEEERRKQEGGGKSRSRSNSRSHSVEGRSGGFNGGMTRSRSFDIGDKSSGNDLPPLTFMSGVENSKNATWKASDKNNAKLDTVEESDAERKKRSAAKKVASKARRLTKAMWGNKIKEARHNKLEN